MPIAVSAYERLAGEMLTLYEQAEAKMLGRVAARLAKGVTVPGWAEKKYAETAAVRKELSGIVGGMSKQRRKMSEEFINTAYNGSAQAFVNEAQRFTEWAGIAHLSPNSAKVAAILSELDTSMDAADRMILRQANDAYADIVGRASARVATGTITVRDAVKDELQDFADRGISSFVDKAGRHWEMSTYAEMATLTAIERATVEGYTETMRSYGFDLAVISSHAGACPLCVAWEGVVVSVSGESHEYPSLEEAENDGVFHPRCLHHLSTYYEGISRDVRSAPRAVQEPSPGYSARMHQRQYERSIRRWKRRMAVATTPEEERQAYAKVRRYQADIRALREKYNNETPASVDWLPRKYWREGGRVKLSAAAKRLPPAKLAK